MPTETERVVIREIHGGARKRLLDTLAPDRMCECGSGPLITGREWVVLIHLDRQKNQGKETALCRSCFAMKWERHSDRESGVYIRKERKRPGGPWFREIRAFVLEPENLRAAREGAGLSQERFADLIGWGRQRLRTAEREVVQVTEHDVARIKEALGDG